MPSADLLFLGVAVLLLLSIVASRVSDRLGVPTLFLFLLLGMLAGSEGIGGIYFDDALLSQSIGTLALAFILFAGGLDTPWGNVRPVLWPSLILSTAGVVITAVAVGAFAALAFGWPWLEALLLGAIISPTDAAAVFSVLRARNVHLPLKLSALLEFESGSNDPMAVILVVSLLQWMGQPSLAWPTFLLTLLQQIVVGGAVGWAVGKGAVLAINRLHLASEGLYPVFTVSLVLLAFGAASSLGGSGFLAVYLAGLLLGNQRFLHKGSLMRFHDGLAWLLQIVMFLLLGLLVFPSRLLPLAGAGLTLSLFLLLVARPLAVFLVCFPFRFSWRQMLFISWVGLRGSAPIILATFALLAATPLAETTFNLVFFVVLMSILVQGTSVPWVAKLLGLETISSSQEKTQRAQRARSIREVTSEIRIRPNSPAVGRRVLELGLPPRVLIVLIEREGDYLVPHGGTLLEADDRLLVLADGHELDQIQALVDVGNPSALPTSGQHNMRNPHE